MAGEALGVDSGAIKDGKCCVTSNGKGHFWYRHGGWEQLQPDGTYKKCKEPAPQDGFVLHDYDSGDELERKSGSWALKDVEDCPVKAAPYDMIDLQIGR